VFPWFRFYSEILDDPKIEHASLKLGLPKATVVGAWAMMMSLASESRERGRLLVADGVGCDVDLLAQIIGLPVETIAQLLEQFQKLGMVEVKDEVISLSNWDKRQYVSDSSAERMRRHRRQGKPDGAAGTVEGDDPSAAAKSEQEAGT
jgi:hypothetical protein